MKYALLLLAGVTAGCSDNDLSMSIVQMEAVTAPACVAIASVGTGLSRGLYDAEAGANFARGYIGVPLIRNNLSPRNPGGVLEYNSIQLTGFNVDLQLPDSVAAKVPAADDRLLHFYYPASAGRLDPAGLGSTFVEIITRQLAMDLMGSVPSSGGLLTVIAKLRPVGMLQSDQVVGGPIWFPIDICSGCINAPIGACPLPLGTPVNPAACNPAQDNPQTCCDNGNGTVTCGAAAVATM
jgi:hypothetical protein